MSSNQGGKLVLVADDEALFVASVLDAVAVHRPDLRLVGVHDGIEALEVVDREPVALILTDLKMPRLDGFGLLGELIARDTRAPVIVITAFSTPEMVRHVSDLGAIHTLEKPIDLEELLDLIDRLLAEPIRVRGLSLAGFAQLLTLENKTGVLRVVATDQREGWLGFLEGRLVDAELGATRGDPAALEILSWELPRLELLTVKPTLSTVESPLQNLLLEAARQSDESGRGPDSVGGLSLDRDDAPPTTQFIPPDDRPRAVGASEDGRAHSSGPQSGPAASDALRLLADAALALDGVLGVAIGEAESGTALVTTGGGVDLEVAVRGFADVVKAKLDVMRQLQLDDSIDEIIVTLPKQYHLIRLLDRFDRLDRETMRYLYLVLDRNESNLASIRLELVRLERADGPAAGFDASSGGNSPE